MLEKIFIKNYKDTSNPKVRIKYGIVAGIFGIITNFILFIIKFIIGMMANSLTIIADSFNNLSDFGSCGVTILGFKLASKPADKEHPYGHARYEYIAGIIVSITVLIIGMLMSKSSIDKMINPQEILATNITYVILVISILGKLIQMCVYKNFAKAIDSPTLRATTIDARNDIIATTTVLVSTILMDKCNLNIDAYTGFIVSLFIIITAIRSLRETVDPLLGSPADLEFVNKIKEIILSHEEIIGIHDLLIHSYGNGNDFATVHAEVSSFMSLLDAHYLADEIEREIQEKLNLGLTIHVDPLDIDNESVIKARKKIKEILKNFDNTLKIHDFRMSASNIENHMNITFDIIVPFNKNYTKEDINKVLVENFKEENDNLSYNFIINLDRPFY
ncbi:MAG: cation transporter [Clostridia bacterium]|nr:cation transporter [Clostridia bacterium]